MTQLGCLLPPLLALLVASSSYRATAGEASPFHSQEDLALLRTEDVSMAQEAAKRLVARGDSHVIGALLKVLPDPIRGPRALLCLREVGNRAMIEAIPYLEAPDDATRQLVTLLLIDHNSHGQFLCVLAIANLYIYASTYDLFPAAFMDNRLMSKIGDPAWVRERISEMCSDRCTSPIVPLTTLLVHGESDQLRVAAAAMIQQLTEARFELVTDAAQEERNKAAEAVIDWHDAKGGRLSWVLRTLPDGRQVARLTEGTVSERTVSEKQK